MNGGGTGKDRNSDDEEFNEIFHDALEIQNMPSQMTLELATAEAMVAVNLFFNNKFQEARLMCEPWSKTSCYHALGYSTFSVLEALMTFNINDIEKGLLALKQCVDVCSQIRRKKTVSDTLGGMVKRINYDNYTDDELHAELCYAESLLQKALLTFMEDETLISFIKGGLKIKSCYFSYKDCYSAHKYKTSWQYIDSTSHFQSGVHFGVGMFNLMISLLPARIMKLLEFIGFSAASNSKAIGLKELTKGSRLKGTIRGNLCSLVLLLYYLVMSYVYGSSDPDMELCHELISSLIQDYPEGSIVLFLAGRYDLVNGNFESAIHNYTKSWKSQTEWKQFHHICYWELMWCHLYNLDFITATHFADILARESSWSKTTYGYQKAALMCMRQEQLSPSEKQELDTLMENIPKWKQKIAGKSLPIEKFAIKKANRYFQEGCRLMLPALELVYVWNGFQVIKKSDERLQNILELLEKTFKDHEASNRPCKSAYYYDNLSLLLSMKGVCLKHLGASFQAEECFREVIDISQGKDLIKDDTYLAAFAMAELGILALDQGDLKNAKTILDSAKNDFKGYSLESRLQFRVHAYLDKIKATDKISNNLPKADEEAIIQDLVNDELNEFDEKACYQAVQDILLNKKDSNEGNNKGEKSPKKCDKTLLRLTPGMLKKRLGKN